MFFTKKPYINFWPIYEDLDVYSPVLPAKKCLPDWWKNININTNEAKTFGTIKKCPGIFDILNYGWVLTAWCDIALNVNSNMSVAWEFSDRKTQAQIHEPQQFLVHTPKHIYEKYSCVFKIKCPWLVKTSPGYSVMLLDPYYHFNEFFDTAAGILDSDIYPNLNPLLLIKKCGEFLIEKDTPLMLIYPFKREKIIGECMSYNKKIINKLQAKIDYISHSKFSAALTYRKEQMKNKKCPFHRD